METATPATPTDPTSRAIRLVLDGLLWDQHLVDQHCWPSVDGLSGQPILRLDTESLLEAKPWSSGEETLIRIAGDLFNGTGYCPLSDVLSGLDSTNQARVLQALRIRWGFEG